MCKCTELRKILGKSNTKLEESYYLISSLLRKAAGVKIGAGIQIDANINGTEDFMGIYVNYIYVYKILYVYNTLPCKY